MTDAERKKANRSHRLRYGDAAASDASDVIAAALASAAAAFDDNLDEPAIEGCCIALAAPLDDLVESLDRETARRAVRLAYKAYVDARSATGTRRAELLAQAHGYVREAVWLGSVCATLAAAEAAKQL